MGLISVEDAQKRLIADCSHSPIEMMALDDCYKRILAEDVSARITQPPFDASAMDGYALLSSDVSTFPTSLKVIGESSAGHPFQGALKSGDAVRIFTGAEVPDGADVIALQEDCERDGELVKVLQANSPGQFIRQCGFDFSEGDVLLKAGQKIGYRHMALLASMNVAEVPIRKRPSVAIIATGDELCMPGSAPQAGQIISSIPFGMKHLIEEAGGQADFIGIALDDLSSLKEFIDKASSYDVLVTIGGASVGDHDLVQQGLKAAGMSLDFWRIAMRPGKPLMVGALQRDGFQQKVVGVPGNPVSALICCFMFVVPLLRQMLQCDEVLSGTFTARLTNTVEANGPRQHYMRSLISHDEFGQMQVTSIENQDSSLQAKFAFSNGLIVRPPHSKEANEGEFVSVLPLDFA